MLAFGIAVPLALLAVFGPAAARDLDDAVRWIVRDDTINTLIGAVFCAVVSTLALRRVRHYPGAAVPRFILPIFALSFGTLLAVITLLRLDYSNRLLIAFFVGMLAARFALTAMRSRSKGLLYALVPGGRAGVINEVLGTNVFTLEKPALEGLVDCAIIADLHADLPAEWERFLAEAAISGRPVFHYKQVWEAETGKVQIDHMSENSLGALVPSLAYQKIKRTIDLLFSLVALPIVLPIMFVCAIFIKAEGGGAVFFRQRRLGFRGKEFHVLKFRTMTEGNDGADRDLSITQAGDKRITKCGQFLRRTRLDELPQIVNVIKGEMSWIGPRPEAISLAEWYDQEIPFYQYRHIVRPGITGWSQVNQGHVTDIGAVHEKLQYDFYYVKNLSYWLDIIIALRTVRVMVSGHGAK